MTFIGVALLVIALFLIPLGLPGLWVMIGVLAVGAITGVVGVTVLAVCFVLAVVAELLEFVFVKRLSEKYGGSRKAFWGALIGGILGVMVGLPIPVIGSMIAGFAGSFVGAGIVAYYETRQLGSAGRVGWGVLLGRIISAVAKTGVGVVILVLGAAALLV